MDSIQLGIKLRDIHKSKGLTMREVANKLGVTTSALSNYENGYREPGVSVLSQLANIYNISIDSLLKDEREQSKDNALFKIYSDFAGSFFPNNTASEAFVNIINMSTSLKDTELKTLRDYFGFLMSQKENNPNTKDTP